MRFLKVLRKIGKILLVTLLSVLLLVIVLLVAAKLSENQITRLALREVSKSINAPVKIDSVSLVLLRRFPYATVEFNGFKLGNFRGAPVDSSAGSRFDTLFSFRKVYVSLKTRPLISSKIEIEKVELEGIALNYFVDKTGRSNFDFLMATDSTQIDSTETADTSALALDGLLRNLTIRDITLNYRDSAMKAAATIKIPEMDISGRILNEFYAGKLRGAVELSNCWFDSTNIHLMRSTRLKFDLDYEDGKLDVKSMNLLTDGANIEAAGKVRLADSIYIDMDFDLADIDIHELTKYAPTGMLAEFGVLDVQGILNIESKVKGYYYDTLLLPGVEARIKFKDGRILTRDYPAIKELYVDGSVSVPNPNDLKTVSANFKSVKVSTPRSWFKLAAKFSNPEKPVYDVTSSGSVNLAEFNSFLPDSTVEYIAGIIGFNFSTNGQLPGNLGLGSADYFLSRTKVDVKVRDLCTALDSVTEVKDMSLNFSYRPSNRTIKIEDFGLKAPSYKVEVKNSSVIAHLLGRVSDMDNMGCNIESFNFEFGSNKLSGKALVQGLKRTTFDLATHAKLDLAELQPFMPDSLVDAISGRVNVAFSSHGTVNLDSIADQIMPIAFEQSQLTANVKDFNFDMFGDTLIRVNNLSLDFAMANDTIRVNNFKANALGMDLWADSTEVWNVYKTKMQGRKDVKLIVQTKLGVSDIDYARFAPLMATDSTQAQAANQESNGASAPKAEPGKDSSAVETAMPIPSYIIRGTFAAKSIKYETFFLQDFSTKFRVDDSLYVIDQMKFNAWGGNMVTSAIYDTRKPLETIIEFQNVATGIDLNKLLLDADAYVKDYISYKNVSGILSSTFNGRIVMQDTNIVFDKINMLGEFKLENGNIRNFEPAMELSKFTNLRELDNIVFRTLESNVFIYNNKIYFPKTDIVSTAIDITAYGMQSFADDYEYHLVVHLGDVLFGKSDKLLKKQGMESDVFEGDDKADRKGLYLAAYQKGTDTYYGFDKKSLQRLMQTTIRVQERGLNLIFHPKVVNFSTNLDRKEYKRKDKK